MALLGRPLLILLALVAVGVPVATLVLWSRLTRLPRVGGRPLLAVAARAGPILTSQLGAVLLLAAAVNEYGYFYASWSELLGHSSKGATVSTLGPGGDGGVGTVGRGTSAPGVRDLTDVRVLGDTGPRTAAGWARQGRTLSVRVDGAGSGLSTAAYVWLPPQYYAPAWRDRRMPAIEVLGGYPGNALGLITRMHYPQVLLAEQRARRAGPMALVMLNPAVVFPRDTECTNVPGGPQVETFLAQDLPAAVSAAFRVRPDGWGLMGHSTGGYCSAKIAMDHFDGFRAAVALSGYFYTLQDHTTGDLWGGSRVLRDLNDPQWRLRHQPAPPTQLFIATSRGERGPQGYVDSRRFLSLARRPLRVTSLVLASGGHNFGAWGREMAPALDWLWSRLAATAPGGSAGYGQ